MSSPKKVAKSKASKKVSEIITNTLFIQIHNEMPEKDIIDTLNGNVGLIDFKKTHGLYKETLLTAALHADLEKVAERILELGPELLDINHVNASDETAFLLACKKGYKGIALTIAALKPKCVPDAEGYTALMYTCVNIDMIDVTKYIITHDICDIGHVNKNGDTALSLTLEVGNPAALPLLLDSGKSKPDHVDPKTGSNLFMKMLIEQDVKTARLVLEKTGLKCDPLRVGKNYKITALMLAIPTPGDDTTDDAIEIIRRLLGFVIEKQDKEYVDVINVEGYSAFDLIFGYSEQNDEPIDPRVVKPFLDYYYKHDPNSQVFLRNVDNICQDTKLYKSLKRLYPSKTSKRIIKNACREFTNAKASVRNATVKSRSPELQTGRRIRVTRSTTKNIGHAFKLPEAIPASPSPDVGFQVGDPRERGLRMRKRRTMRGR